MYEKKKKETIKDGFSGTKNGNETSSNETVTANDELRQLIAQFVAEAVKNERASFEKDFEGRIASEREDAQRLASMSAEDRAKVEMERREKDFESERAQYVSERAEFEAAKELAARDLPVSFAKMVANPDREIMIENIDAFKTEYMKAIEAGLSNRLKGTLPRVSREKGNISDPFLNGLGM